MLRFLNKFFVSRSKLLLNGNLKKRALIYCNCFLRELGNLYRCFRDFNSFGYLWKCDLPAEVSLLLCCLKPRLNLKTRKCVGTRSRKAKNKQPKKNTKTFAVKKDKKANICFLLFYFYLLLQQEVFQALPRVSFFLSLCAVLSPFYREISNILPFHNTLESRAHYCYFESR